VAAIESIHFQHHTSDKMKVSSFFVLAASTLAVSQSPSSCKGGGKRNGADFVLTDQGVNKHLAPLSKIFTNAKQRVNVSDVFNDGNHKMGGTATKLSWEKTSSFNDVDTKKWYPQGISSTADAAEVGTYDGKDGWLVSWYSDEAHQVRISFVNKATKKYRHALLVYPAADDNFSAVGVHAGGIMWYGDTLWVVDTSNGIRVFDMSNIWKVGSGDKVGKISAGKYSAAGYKYVIPQIRYVHMTAPGVRQVFIEANFTSTGGTSGRLRSHSDFPTSRWTGLPPRTASWLESTSQTRRTLSAWYNSSLTTPPVP
jgi:hypothetical protein